MDGGIMEAALLSAAVGGGTAAITGGDPLKGALMGGLSGGIMGGLGGVMPGAEVVPTPSAAVVPTPSAGIASLPEAISTQAGSGIGALNPDFAPSPETAGVGAPGTSMMSSNPAVQYDTGSLPADVSAPPATPSSFQQAMNDPTGYMANHKMMMAGAALQGARQSLHPTVPGQKPYTGPLSRFHYNPDTYRPTVGYADGGITSLGMDTDMSIGGDPRNNPPPIDQDNNSSAGWQSRSLPAQAMATGGIASLGGYSDGGHMLKGPGDGMSDSIPASIGDKRPARLATDEFVVPADVVSHLGNGSSDAGAKQLYAMMDRVRKARTGNPKQGKQINASRQMPA